MKLLILLALASISWAQNFPISLVNEVGIVGSLRSMSAIITLPPCMLAREMVEVTVHNSSGQGPMQPMFEMPFCRSRRDLIHLVSNFGGIYQILNLGYQVEMLQPSTTYNVSYRVGSRTSDMLQFTTISPVDYMTIDTGFGRSGAMVVITVLLVIAMVALIIGLIVVLVLSK